MKKWMPNAVVAAKINLKRLSHHSFVRQFHGRAPAFQPFQNALQTTSRQRKVTRKFGGAVDNARLSEGGEPHLLRFVEYIFTITC
ncbi:hypothetical protein [Paenibacillus hamazuiensis]|uniref:hypothetical protein n=1 Tax=Paenibacillus hamazuiensis TaxID=2936508 RepID=UPI00200C933E|nr:hypothetical protein [Paenibacillus hamazuiensis]